jgi:hypothetical protein
MMRAQRITAAWASRRWSRPCTTVNAARGLLKLVDERRIIGYGCFVSVARELKWKK